MVIAGPGGADPDADPQRYQSDAWRSYTGGDGSDVGEVSVTAAQSTPSDSSSSETDLSPALLVSGVALLLLLASRDEEGET
jgi:hypothetical protein